MHFNNPLSTKNKSRNMTNINRIKTAADSQNVRNKQECRSLWRSALLLITMTFTCFGPLKSTQAVTPAPDGGYANENTAEGDNALASLTTGARNTAIGWKALFIKTTGSENTAIGDHTLRYNATGYDNKACGSSALANNTTSVHNTATGENPLYS